MTSISKYKTSWSVSLAAALARAAGLTAVARWCIVVALLRSKEAFYSVCRKYRLFWHWMICLRKIVNSAGEVVKYRQTEARCKDQSLSWSVSHAFFRLFFDHIFYAKLKASKHQTKAFSKLNKKRKINREKKFCPSSYSETSLTRKRRSPRI